jgi:hypothetical protein
MLEKEVKLKRRTRRLVPFAVVGVVVVGALVAVLVASENRASNGNGKGVDRRTERPTWAANLKPHMGACSEQAGFISCVGVSGFGRIRDEAAGEAQELALGAIFEYLNFHGEGARDALRRSFLRITSTVMGQINPNRNRGGITSEYYWEMYNPPEGKRQDEGGPRYEHLVFVRFDIWDDAQKELVKEVASRP